jgi:putative colanic acid biosynthesis UDP-glucose lipid carrier transferase
MNRRSIAFLQVVCAGWDLVMLNLTVFISQQFFLADVPISSLSYYFHFLLFMHGAWIGLCLLGLIYNENYIIDFEKFVGKTIKVYFGWVIAALTFFFIFQSLQLPRMFVLSIISGFGILLTINRCIYFLVRQRYRYQDQFIKRIMILGYNDAAKKLTGYLETSFNTEIVGYCEEAENVKELSRYPIVNNVGNAMVSAKSMGVNEIYSTIAPSHNGQIYSLMQEADQQCIRFRIIPDFSLFINHPVHIDYLHDIPVIALRSEPLQDIGNQFHKRLFDIVVSLFAIVFVLSWLIPLLGILIWLESRGPLFFVQERSGKDNKIFRCFKFRSMKMNKDANLKQAERNDDRFTRIGKFIRRTNLDEFPQFFNVLKGEMSVVGPRPHMLRHTEDYSKMLQQYMVRQFLKPGVTGWAQVNGFRGEIKDENHLRRRVEHDIWYMENWTLLLDIKIILLTFFKTFKGDENAF